MNRHCIALLLICAVLLLQTFSFAQGENNHWHFGYGCQIDFSTPTPTGNSSSSMSTFECSATASNAQGVLQFYTIGSRVWDSNGNEMPNATGLLGNGPVSNGVPVGSCRDCVQILPNLANANQYFVFVGTPTEQGLDKIYCNTVDMSLNAGLGDIVTTTKNMLLFDAGHYGLSEITATAYGTCNNYWFIATANPNQNNAFYAFKVDANGISNTPVISIPNYTGYLNKIKILNTKDEAYIESADGIIHADFDRSTGQFSNFQLIPNTLTAYSEISPNEQLLYINTNGVIKQFNLQLYPNIAAISASGQTVVATNGPHFSMRSGPDGKIYIIDQGSFVSRIEQPDIIGPGCGYTPQVLSFSPNSGTGIHMFGAVLKGPPNTSIDTISQHIAATLFCAGDSISLTASHPEDPSFYWNNGHTGSEYIATLPGNYWVHSSPDQCTVNLDSFSVTIAPSPLRLGNDTDICMGDSYILDAYYPEANAYSWSTGSTDPSITISAAGTYTVTTQTEHCTLTDTIRVSVTEPIFALLQNDTTICTGSPLRLEATTNMNSTIRWNTGQTGPAITINGAGIYTAYTENKCGLQTDSVRIGEINCNCRPITPNAFTPNGDGRNDIFMPVFNPDCDALYYELKIYNRYGQLVYMTNRRGTGWDGTYSNNRPADAGVYFYTISLSNRYGDTDKQLLKGDITLIR